MLIKILRCFLLIMLIQFDRVSAQPVLTKENSIERLIGLATGVDRYDAVSMDGVSELVARFGPDQIWDLSNLSFGPPDSEEIDYAKPRLDMPGATDPRLLDANTVAFSNKSAPTWTYLQLDDSGHYVIARVTVKDVDRDGERDTLVTLFNPRSTKFPFPLSIGTVWEDSTTQTLEFHGSPPIPTETAVSSHTVEGWGLLVTRESEQPALRIRTDERVIANGGQRSRRHIISFVTAIPEGLGDEFVYGSGAEIVVDSLDRPISLRYLAVSVSRPTRLENIETRALALALDPNYPNPFASETTIPFRLDNPEIVRISVFDIVGRRTAELLSAALPSGNHKIVWNAGNTSNGMYRVVLQSGRGSTARIVIVQR